MAICRWQCRPRAVEGRKPAMLPAIRARAGTHDCMPWAAGVAKIHSVGTIDSGASAATVPARMLGRLGIAADEGSRVPAYSASGHHSAHAARIGMDVRHNGRWHGLGAVDVLAPDAAESRSPGSACPSFSGGTAFSTGRACAWTTPG